MSEPNNKPPSTLRQAFEKIGAKALYIAPSVQEAAFATVYHYGQIALRLM